MDPRAENDAVTPPIIDIPDRDMVESEVSRRQLFIGTMGELELTAETGEVELRRVAALFSLDDARRLHSLSLSYREADFVGAVALEEKTDVIQLSDVTQPECVVANGEGDFYWQMHFYPFKANDKIPEYALDTAFLAYTDMVGVSEYAEESLEMPSFLFRSTNPTMANFARSRLRFHLSGARNVSYDEESGYKDLDPIPSDEVETTFLDRVRIKDSLSAYDTTQLQVWFDLFLTDDELVDPKYREYLETMRQSVYARALETGRTQAASANDYEKEVRIRASLVNLSKLLEMMRQEEESIGEIENRLERSEHMLDMLRARRYRRRTPVAKPSRDEPDTKS